MRSSVPPHLSSRITPPSKMWPTACLLSRMAAYPEFARARRGGRRPSLAGDAMGVLDTKLFRDLRHLWPQALAIALVIGGAVATLVAAAGSIRSLEETRAAYYERYQFADVFALVKRAPKALVDRIAQIPGVAAVEPRIAKLALLDIP